jgi:hypothetical protein
VGQHLSGLRHVPPQEVIGEGVDDTVLWRRLDKPGHEFGRLFSLKSRWHLAGMAVFLHDKKPTQLAYDVVCDSNWQTLSGKVAGWLGNKAIEMEISVDSDHRWQLNGKERPEVAGCIDLDLNFSPSTNLLPIRRLGLAIGQEAEVKAAWLRFPEFTLEPLVQRYRRIDTTTYQYESAGGKFVRELQVNAAGFVTHYPDFWQPELNQR